MGRSVAAYFARKNYKVCVASRDRYSDFEQGFPFSIEFVDFSEVLGGGTTANFYDVVINCIGDYGRLSDQNLKEANFSVPRSCFQALRSRTNIFVNIDTVLDSKVSKYAESKNLFRDFLKEQTEHSDRCGLCRIINIRFDLIYGSGDRSGGFLGILIERVLMPVHDHSHLLKPLIVTNPNIIRGFTPVTFVGKVILKAIDACKETNSHLDAVFTGQKSELRYFIRALYKSSGEKLPFEKIVALKESSEHGYRQEHILSTQSPCFAGLHVPSIEESCEKLFYSLDRSG